MAVCQKITKSILYHFYIFHIAIPLRYMKLKHLHSALYLIIMFLKTAALLILSASTSVAFAPASSSSITTSKSVTMTSVAMSSKTESSPLISEQEDRRSFVTKVRYLLDHSLSVQRFKSNVTHNIYL